MHGPCRFGGIGRKTRNGDRFRRLNDPFEARGLVRGVRGPGEENLYALRAIKAEWARLQRQAAGVHLIVPSHRIAEEAGALGFERVYVASSATVQDMVAGVFEWQEQ